MALQHVTAKFLWQMYSDSTTGNAYATVDLNLFANTGLQRSLEYMAVGINKCRAHSSVTGKQPGSCTLCSLL